MCPECVGADEFCSAFLKYQVSPRILCNVDASQGSLFVIVATLCIALGVKEVWEVPAHVFKKGYIQHTLGWPLQSAVTGADTFGGSFLYHQEPNVSSILQLH